MADSDFNSAMESLRKTAKLVTEGLRPHIEKLTAGISESIKPLVKLIRNTLEEHALNIKTGWWYPNYIVDDLPSEIVHEALVNEGKTKAFTKLVTKECRRNDYALLRDMHKRWQSYDFLRPGRKKILADIIAAHIDTRYSLSIPVAMIQIDYFHHAIFPKKGEIDLEYTTRERIAAIQQINFAYHFKRDDYTKVPANIYFSLYPVYHYFKNILYAGKKLREFQRYHDPEIYRLSKLNNRGSILHGENANYSSEARSLKQILLIDKILHTINRLDKNTLL